MIGVLNANCCNSKYYTEKAGDVKRGEQGRGRIENGEWRLEVGGWRLEVGWWMLVTDP